MRLSYITGFHYTWSIFRNHILSTTNYCQSNTLVLVLVLVSDIVNLCLGPLFLVSRCLVPVLILVSGCLVLVLVLVSDGLVSTTTLLKMLTGFTS